MPESTRVCHTWGGCAYQGPALQSFDVRGDPSYMDFRAPISEWSQRRLIVLDVIVAILAAVVLAVSSPAPQIEGWVKLVVILIVAAPLAARRFWPLPMFFLSLTGAIVSAALGVASGPGFVAAAFALYTVAVETPHLRREPTIAIAILTIAVLMVGAFGGPAAEFDIGVSDVVVGVAAMGVAWTSGRYVQQRHRYEAASADHLAQTAVSKERVRIARELHDIVAHTLSLITVKASVARHVAATHPDETRVALEVIESTSRDATDEIRRLLAVLRPEAYEPSTPHRVSDIPRLVERMDNRESEVDLRISDAERLSASLQAAIYRIVQESLTNAVRHSPQSWIRVIVERDDDGICVEITNGPSPVEHPRRRKPPAHRGLGLMGMKERAALHGGNVDAGTTSEGGYRILARFPDPLVEP